MLQKIQERVQIARKNKVLANTKKLQQRGHMWHQSKNERGAK